MAGNRCFPLLLLLAAGAPAAHGQGFTACDLNQDSQLTFTDVPPLISQSAVASLSLLKSI